LRRKGSEWKQASVPTYSDFEIRLKMTLLMARVPGERLDPEALGRELQVSRTPVREAFKQLVASGLVTV
jgi:DNA-binding GntR family transcriptional regulator